MTPERIKELLKRPSDCGYFGDNEELWKTWTLGPVIEHRDSTILEQSNAAMVVKELKEHAEFNEQWNIEHWSHWAVGWVDHLSYRVVDEHGQPTAVAKFLERWFRKLRDSYPIADEEDYCERQQKAACDYIAGELPSLLAGEVPEDAAEDVWSWLWENMQNELEDSDDRGAAPSREAIVCACKALNLPLEEE